MLLKESVDLENQHLDMHSLRSHEGKLNPYLFEPQKAHPTREFVVVVVLLRCFLWPTV